MNLLNQHDWNSLVRNFNGSYPFQYVVIDDLLTDDYYAQVRSAILGDWGWRQKNWQVEQLFTVRPKIPHFEELVSSLKLSLYSLIGSYELMKYWAVMCHRNVGLHAHSDNAMLALNLWLTPDECNLNQNTGGMILHDVKRSEEMQVHEFNAAPWAIDYLKSNTKGEIIKIPYKNNRAVLFDARIFHESDIVTFDSTSVDACRINLTLAFDDSAAYHKRMERYKNGDAY